MEKIKKTEKEEALMKISFAIQSQYEISGNDGDIDTMNGIKISLEKDELSPARALELIQEIVSSRQDHK